MRDIINLMKYDFYNIQSQLKLFVIMSSFFIPLGFFLYPETSVYFILIAMIFVSPLHGMSEKYNFNKLYGLIPVKRKNIIRAKFLFIFIAHFFMEMISYSVIIIAINTKWYKLIVDTKTAFGKIANTSFKDDQLYIGIIFATVIFASMCSIFIYVEMMGQIFGRKNELKITIITFFILTLLAIGLTKFVNPDFTNFKMPSTPKTYESLIKFSMIINLITLAISIFLSEITAAIISRREL